MKLLTGNSNKNLSQKISKYLKTKLVNSNIRKFADGEIYVEINENIRGNNIFIIQSISSPANDNLLEMLLCIDALKRSSAKNITAVIPYFGYARQDRKVVPRTSISAKLVSNLITKAGADRVVTVDLHAGQIQGFFDIPVDHLYASPVFFDELQSRDVSNMTIFSPDVGGMKMANAYAEWLGCPLGFVAKRRTGASTVEAMNLVGEVEGREILLVDDMTETAGTLTAAAKLLKERGVEPPLKISPRTGKETFALAKSDEGFKKLLEHSNLEVQALANARLGIKSTLEETRTQRFIDISNRGSFGVPLSYCGAHTTRWSGLDKINLQNLPSRGENANSLKKCILAPEGHVLIDADSAQIEARVLAWFAKQDDLVKQFENKE